MTLYIDTSEYELIILALIVKTKNKEEEIARKKFKAGGKTQSEKLLLCIDKFLNSEKISWQKIKAIKVRNEGGSFTGLRLGVITANTLAWSKGIEVIATKNSYIKKNGIKMVKPIYNKKPDIVINKNKYGLD
jgi:tRNA A37 threonylcarbamoyladenosine modification protein TsaB